MTAGSKLPDEVLAYFWDYPSTRLSLVKDQSLILRRILMDGSWDAILWLREQVGDDAIRKWLLEHRGRGLSPRQLRFWELILDLPAEQVDDWVRTASDSPWGKR
jgi:hypothetical protein